MKLSDFKECLDNVEVFKDGEFETFAQCIVKLGKKIVTFYDDEKYLDDLKDNEQISCVICSKENIKKIPTDKGILVCDEPRYIFFKLYNLVMEKNAREKNLVIGKNLVKGKNVCISEENVIIGNNVYIGNNTVIERNTIIEDNVIIGPNCVIGSEGYEVKRRKDGSLFPVSHYGKVLIKEKTTIKSMVNIHKAVFEWDATEIGKNCVIDSFTHIAHGNKIGNSVLIGANCTISGNCKINEFACIDPGACIAKRLTIGERSKVNIGSVVTKNVIPNSTVTGNFAVEHKKWIDFVKNISK